MESFDVESPIFFYRFGLMLLLLHASIIFTLRSVVTVVANSCPPTQSVMMEEGDRGLSGGSIVLERRSTKRSSLSASFSFLPSRSKAQSSRL